MHGVNCCIKEGILPSWKGSNLTIIGPTGPQPQDPGPGSWPRTRVRGTRVQVIQSLLHPTFNRYLMDGESQRVRYLMVFECQRWCERFSLTVYEKVPKQGL